LKEKKKKKKEIERRRRGEPKQLRAGNRLLVLNEAR
jgi:hypothetical protein